MDRNAGAGTTVVSWIALIISIVALVLAWTAFNRAGDDVGETLQDQLQIETNEEQNNGTENDGLDGFDLDNEADTNDQNDTGETEPNDQQ